jgi:chorismate-pyruvate lyase
MGFGPNAPIGLVMKNNKIEQFRDVYSIKFEEISEELSQKLSIPRQKLFQRSYHVYSSNEAQMHIHEILLPDLETHLTQSLNPLAYLTP